MIEDKSEELPAEEEIESMYSLVLDHLLFSPSLRDQLMKSESLEKKWQMAKMHQKIFESGTESCVQLLWSGKDSKMLKSLFNEKVLDIKKLLELKSLLSTANKEWMIEFLKNDGILLIFDSVEFLLSRVPMSELDAALLFELIACCKVVMNNGLGMDATLEMPRSLDLIALSLRFEWKPIALQVRL